MSRILALIKYLTELRELIANIAIVSTHIYSHTIAALVHLEYQIQCKVQLFQYKATTAESGVLTRLV